MSENLYQKLKTLESAKPIIKSVLNGGTISDATSKTENLTPRDGENILKKLISDMCGMSFTEKLKLQNYLYSRSHNFALHASMYEQSILRQLKIKHDEKQMNSVYDQQISEQIRWLKSYASKSVTNDKNGLRDIKTMTKKVEHEIASIERNRDAFSSCIYEKDSFLKVDRLKELINYLVKCGFISFGVKAPN